MARLNRISLPIALLFAALPALATPPSATSAGSAESIVRSMSRKYSGLRSYQDEGESTRRLKTDAAPPDRRSLRFTTHFSRPDKLRFEWIQPGAQGGEERFLLWSDGKTVHDAFPVGGTVRRESSLQDGIASATGLSQSSGYTLPTLLVPEAAVQRLDQLTGLTLDRRETFEGTECFVISGRHPRSATRYTLWIGTGDLLLRRVQRVFERGNVEDEIHRSIRVNERIPDPVFTGPATAGTR